MFTNNLAFYQLRDELEVLYDVSEATAIAHEIMLHITGQDKMQRLMNKDHALSAEQEMEYIRIREHLLNGMPVQYAIGKSWFLGRQFTVNQDVLIPRPETEELVQWIINDNTEKHTHAWSIIDVGTGSGCIPISLKLELSKVQITSCDVSENALFIARLNAADLSADIHFIHLNFTNQESWKQLKKYDIVVSNPPYIPLAERELLHANVREYEPAIALFVPSEDPLLFYKSIAAFGKVHLNKGGTIYCELHVDYAKDTRKMFELYGYSNVIVKKDMHGNDRMLRASL
jgi:release factor glutamine methyltransferase